MFSYKFQQFGALVREFEFEILNERGRAMPELPKLVSVPKFKHEPLARINRPLKLRDHKGR
jgi:hypothetical protein